MAFMTNDQIDKLRADRVEASSKRSKKSAKEQKQANEIERIQIQKQNEIVEWPLVLLKAIQRASSFPITNVIVSTSKSEVCFTFYKSDYNEVIKFPYELTEENHSRVMNNNYWDLISELDIVEEKEREAARIASLKETALAKLTDEEKKALGF